MADSKSRFIGILRECATLLEIKGENPFRCRAYENAARALQGVEGDPASWHAEGSLADVKGVGKGILGALDEFVTAGDVEIHRELREELPAGLLDMVSIPGVGPKKVRALWEKLGVDTLEKLEEAARGEELAAMDGFGKKTAEKILAGIDQRRKFSGRHRADVAREAADKILTRLAKLKCVRRIELAGSMRRARETIKDLDVVVDSDAPEEVMEAFVSAPGIARVVNHGPTKSSVLMESGIPVDLRVVGADSFAATLNYFTGSKEHNTRMRGRAKKAGMRLNEYGLYRDREETPIPCGTEADIYRALGLEYVEPELREDRGEIEAAESGKLPRLITMRDMRGLLHCHSTYSDGKATLEQMARAAKKAGYEYFGICDHSKTAAYAGGLKEDDVLRQHDEIDALNQSLDGITILKGIESDILGEGELDYSDTFLDRFDFVVISVHSRFQMTSDEMTRRICTAISHPAATILGHPTGRLLLAREPYSLDMDAVLEAAARHRVAVEINANPHRLDLDWTYIPAAKRAGCVFSVNPDAHTTEGIADVSYGIGIARKGWLTAEDVINTRTLKGFRAWLAERRATAPAKPEEKSPPAVEPTTKKKSAPRKKSSPRKPRSKT